MFLSPEAGERRTIAKCDSDSAAFRSGDEDDRPALIVRASWFILGPVGELSGQAVCKEDPRVACRPRPRRPRDSSPVDRPHGRLAATGAADRAGRPAAGRRGLARLGRGQARRVRGGRRGCLRALVRRSAGGPRAPLAAAGLQSHRHGTAHQPRSRGDGREGNCRGRRSHALADHPGIRPGRRGAGRARPAPRRRRR